MAVTDPDAASRPTASPRSSSTGRPGLRRRPQGTQDGHQGLARPASSTSPTAPSRPTGSSARPAPASRPRCGRWTSPARRSARRPSASRRARWTRRCAYVKERKQFGTSDRRFPGRAVHARRHGDEDRGRPAPGLRRRGRGGARPSRRSASSPPRPRRSPPTSRCR